MEKLLVIKPEVCIGCRSCELICAFNRAEVFSPAASAVTVFEFSRSCVTVPLMCMQCNDPHCVEVCPVGALTRCERTGVVGYDPSKCIGCKMCLNACPLGNISFSGPGGGLVKCTLCGGDPMCVKICPVGAVEYADLPNDMAVSSL